MSNRRKAVLAIILSGVLGGGNAVFNKLGLKEFPSLLFIFLRFLITAIILVPFLSQKPVKISANLKKLFLISTLPVINILLFAYGVQRTSANIATMIYTATPITVAVLSFFHLKEKYRMKRIIGILVGFVGTITIVLLPVIEHKSLVQIDLLANLAIFLGMMLFSYFSVLSTKFHEEYSPAFITFIFAITAMILTGVFAFKDVIENPHLFFHITSSGWLGLFYVGILGSIALYLLFQYAIKYGGPLIGSMNSYLQPISGVVWAAFILGEKVTPIFIIGSFITLCGVWLVTLQKRK